MAFTQRQVLLLKSFPVPPPFSSLLVIIFEFSDCLWILFPNINKWKQQRISSQKDLGYYYHTRA